MKYFILFSLLLSGCATAKVTKGFFCYKVTGPMEIASVDTKEEAEALIRKMDWEMRGPGNALGAFGNGPAAAYRFRCNAVELREKE